MKRKIKYSGLIILLGLTITLTGCLGSAGVGSADFDLGKFFGNPIVIVAIVVLVVWMWSRGKKGG